MPRTLKDAAGQWLIRKAVIALARQLQQKAATMNILPGLKTYLTAALILVAAGAQFFGIMLPGVEAGPSELIAIALGLVFARMGATKEASDVKHGR